MPAEPITSAGFSISVQCWSFRKYTLFEAIEMAAGAGANVEIFPGQKLGGPHGGMKLEPSLSDEVIASIQSHLEKHGSGAVNLGIASIPKEEKAARPVFELAKKLGLYGVTTESLEAIDTLEKLSGEYDLKVCFHNHPKPTKLWHPDTIWKAIDGRHPNLGYCADIGHWATSGLDPLEVIKKVAPRVHALHLKDRASIEQWTHDRPYGTGIIDLVSILDEVRQYGFA